MSCVEDLLKTIGVVILVVGIFVGTMTAFEAMDRESWYSLGFASCVIVISISINSLFKVIANISNTMKRIEEKMKNFSCRARLKLTSAHTEFK